MVGVGGSKNWLLFVNVINRRLHTLKMGGAKKRGQGKLGQGVSALKVGGEGGEVGTPLQTMI